MLEASGIDAPAAGNIGSALSEHVDRGHEAVVVEVSSFQLRFCEGFHPTAAAITKWRWTISTGTARSIHTAAKARIFVNQTDEDLLVYDADDEGAASWSPGRGANCSRSRGASSGRRRWSRRRPSSDRRVDHLDRRPRVRRPGPLWSTSPRLPPSHCAWGRPPRRGEGGQVIRAGPHRRSLVARSGGVTWVDDSKATNPHAALASIGPTLGRPHRRGPGQGARRRPARPRPNVRFLVGIGEAGPDLASAAGERGRVAGTMDEAVALAASWRARRHGAAGARLRQLRHVRLLRRAGGRIRGLGPVDHGGGKVRMTANVTSMRRSGRRPAAGPSGSR